MVLDHYIIVPTTELLHRFEADESNYPSKKIWKDRFRPWFVVEPSGEVIDLGKNNKKTRAAVRSSYGDYTRYYRNWDELAELARERGRSVSLAL